MHAGDHVVVALIRPAGYEDVHAELLAEDAMDPAWQWDLLADQGTHVVLAIHRPDHADEFAEPPFGIAEWLAFADATAPHAATRVRGAGLVQRFEEDLVHTWTAWTQLLRHLGPASVQPHPRLVPARACWLGSPDLAVEAPALGLHRLHGRGPC